MDGKIIYDLCGKIETVPGLWIEELKGALIADRNFKVNQEERIFCRLGRVAVNDGIVLCRFLDVYHFRLSQLLWTKRRLRVGPLLKAFREGALVGGAQSFAGSPRSRYGRCRDVSLISFGLWSCIAGLGLGRLTFEVLRARTPQCEERYRSKHKSRFSHP